MERILDHPLNLDAYLGNAVVFLSSSASRTDWLQADNIPALRQRPLSRAIDEVIYQELPGDWLHGIPPPALELYMQDREFCSALPTLPLYVIPLLTSLVTTRLAVVEMVTGSHDIMQFVMSYSLLPNPLHSYPPVKPAMLKAC